jgi:hypothetical protein
MPDLVLILCETKVLSDASSKFIGMFHGVRQVSSDMAECESTFGLSLPYHDYE